MQFKMLIFDLDGTAIPNKPEGMPSKKVIEAVAKAQKIIKVGIATGRSVSNCRDILKALDIISPSIVAGGTQIINPKSEKTLWKRDLSMEQLKRILDISLPYGYKINLGDDNGYLHIKENQISKPYQIAYIMFVVPKDAKQIIRKLSNIKDITVHEVISWKKDHFDIHITHKEATKKYSLEELLKIVDVDRKDILVVGDSNNDRPLFEVAGYKVAMGNGSDGLKSIADYIAPSVEDNGLAQVIEKFILVN